MREFGGPEGGVGGGKESKQGEGTGVVSSSTGLRTEGMLRILDEAVPGLRPSEEDTRSMKEGLAGGIGSGIVRRRLVKSRFRGIPLVSTYILLRRVDVARLVGRLLR